MRTRREVLGVLAGAVVASRAAVAGAPTADAQDDVAAPPDEAALRAEVDAALRRATQYLVERRAPDGAWYSQTYGAFKDGFSLTPLVLLALAYAPADPRLPVVMQQGADFLAGAVTFDGPTPRVRPAPIGYSYPTESLALSATVLSLPPNASLRRARDLLLEELRARQLGPATGFTPADPNEGGFGYGQGRPSRPREGLPPDDPRCANLAATLLAVGALRFGGAPATDPALVAARRFVVRCVNPDGGFHFAPQGEAVNKAGRVPASQGGGFASYGSMTADGFRALRHLADPSDAPRLRAALRWLHQHFDPSRAAGDYAADRTLQRDAVYYYQTWSLAHALAESSPPAIETARGRVRWAAAMARALLERQRPDGGFRNPATDLREDDPLLATPLAMAALGLVRFHWSGRLQASMPMTDLRLQAP